MSQGYIRYGGVVQTGSMFKECLKLYVDSS